MTAVALVSVPPTVFAALGCALTLLAIGVVPGAGLLRDTIVLGACAAVSAPANLRLLLRNSPAAAGEIIEAMTRIDRIAAFATEVDAALCEFVTKTVAGLKAAGVSTASLVNGTLAALNQVVLHAPGLVADTRSIGVAALELIPASRVLRTRYLVLSKSRTDSTR